MGRTGRFQADCGLGGFRPARPQPRFGRVGPGQDVSVSPDPQPPCRRGRPRVGTFPSHPTPDPAGREGQAVSRNLLEELTGSKAHEKGVGEPRGACQLRVNIPMDDAGGPGGTWLDSMGSRGTSPSAEQSQGQKWDFPAASLQCEVGLGHYYRPPPSPVKEGGTPLHGGSDLTNSYSSTGFSPSQGLNPPLL